MPYLGQFPVVSKIEVEKLKKTIKVLSQILADLRIEYRIFGSVTMAAILGRPQRRIADIDLMVALNDKERLFRRLSKEGYLLEERKFRLLGINFVWGEAVKDDLLELTIFLGNFDRAGNFRVEVSKDISVIALSKAIESTSYTLYGTKFVGIPAMTVYYGAWASRGNPKRKYDLAVFTVKEIKKPPRDYSVIDVYYKGKKLSFLYPLGCFLQDILGRFSLLLGGNYDFWRR